MLFDARRALPDVNQDILAAADYLREHGWCQHTSRDKEAHVCMAGAIHMVTNGWYTVGRQKRALEYVVAHLGAVIPEWNDVPGRTKEQVIAKLEEIGWGETMRDVNGKSGG